MTQKLPFHFNKEKMADSRQIVVNDKNVTEEEHFKWSIDTWKVIEALFNDTGGSGEHHLVRHQIEGYNLFIEKELPIMIEQFNKNNQEDLLGMEEKR